MARSIRWISSPFSTNGRWAAEGIGRCWSVRVSCFYVLLLTLYGGDLDWQHYSDFAGTNGDLVVRSGWCGGGGVRVFRWWV